MNGFFVVGVVAIAIGTYLATLDVVVGAIYVAIGTFVMRYGDWRESRADARRTHKKLSEIERKITSAKQGASSPQETEKLENIDQEFREWAAGFVKNKARSQLEVQQTRIGAVESEINRSEIWRPVLELFIETVRQVVQAYAAETGSAISVKLSPLPANLFDKHASYEGVVLFTPTVKWRFELDRGVSVLEFPVLWIWLYHGKAQTRIVHIWSYDRQDAFVRVSLHGDELPRLSGIEVRASEKTYPEELRRSAQRLIEAQLLSL